jgi:integrase
MLTEIAISKLPIPEKRKSYPAGGVPGLFLLIQPTTGVRSWALQYRSNGIQRKLTLGSHPTVGLSEARRLARAALGDVARGEDPAAAKQAARAAAKAEREADADRIEKVVELFVERHAKPRTKRWLETQRILAREVVGRWSGRRLSQITRPMIHEMTDAVMDRGASIYANRIFEHFRTMCRWAVERGIIERSPCEGMKAPAAETRRDRVLADDEIRLAWQAFESVGWPFGPIGKLLFLTGARLNEVAGMEWKELDLLEARTWTLPALRTKNKQAHVIPLSGMAIEIIKSLPVVEPRHFVFTTTRRTHVSGFSNGKKDIDAAMKAAADKDGEPISHWTMHDIRRSVATGLQKLGVRLEVTEAVLNHVGGSRRGVVGIYQRHDWAEEKRAALETWSRRLEAIVTGKAAENVVELVKARAS